MKTLLFSIGSAVILVTGAIYLYAKPYPAAPQITAQPALSQAQTAPTRSPTTTDSSLEVSGWLTYSDPTLGISFQYPPSYHIYQSSANYIVVVTDYRDPQNPSLQVTLRFLHYNDDIPSPTPSSIRADSQSYLSTTHNGYQVIHTTDLYGFWEVYILSDRGVFAIADNMDSDSVFTRQLKKTGAYDSYRQIFERVVDSVSIR